MNRSTYHSELESLFSKDAKYLVEGTLNKNKIAELAHKHDAELIGKLIANESMRKLFFVEAEDSALVFYKDKFIHFISNKEFLPNSFTAYKNKIGLGGGLNLTELLSEKKDVALNWPFKDCVLEGGQDREDAKRDEIFHNWTLAPDQIDRLLDEKSLTGFKRYHKDGESEVEKITATDNLVIRGNNLIALHSIKRRYAGRVKLIYIDPPYNTGSDNFKYNDKFNQSSWLTFMRNRIEVSRQLLSEDGVFIVQIDDNQLAELKILCSEVFGKSPSENSNFVQYIEVKANVGAANEYQNPFMPKNCEYLLVFAKNYDKRKYKPIWVPSKIDPAYSKIITNFEERDFHKWKVGLVKDEYEKESGHPPQLGSDEYRDYIIKNSPRIFRTIAPKGAGAGLKRAMDESQKSPSGWSIYERSGGGEKDDIYTHGGGMVRFYSKNVRPLRDGSDEIVRELGSLWTDISWTGIANEGGVTLKNGKKPERLLKRIIEMATEPGDIVLDYHLGSGTTVAVAHKLGRQYIGIEQLDYGENDAITRLQNVVGGDTTGISKSVSWPGGGGFIYAQLMDLGSALLEKISSAKTDECLAGLLDMVKASSFLSHVVDPKLIDPGDSGFSSLNIAEKKLLLADLVDKNHLYVNYSEIDDVDYGVSEYDKILNKQFYEGGGS